MHSHPPAVVLAFGTSQVRFTFPNGASRAAQATEGQAYWNPAASHEVVNDGQVPVHNLMVELKGTSIESAEQREWDAAFLPLAAAPDQHKVLIDNERVRVLEVD